MRLFEAAACAVPIISDYWPGLDSLFEIGAEILIAYDTEEVLRFLRDIPDEKRGHIAHRARQRVLAEHTAAHRALELETYFRSAASSLRNRLDRLRHMESAERVFQIESAGIPPASLSNAPS